MVRACRSIPQGNATEAARLAGYSGNDHTLAQTAHELLRSPRIGDRVKAHLANLCASASHVLAELSALAMAPWEKHIIEIRNGKGDLVGARLDLRDKVRALELLGKYHGLFDANTRSLPKDERELDALLISELERVKGKEAGAALAAFLGLQRETEH